MIRDCLHQNLPHPSQSQSWAVEVVTFSSYHPPLLMGRDNSLLLHWYKLDYFPPHNQCLLSYHPRDQWRILRHCFDCRTLYSRRTVRGLLVRGLLPDMFSGGGMVSYVLPREGDCFHHYDPHLLLQTDRVDCWSHIWMMRVTPC
uniref:Uncharacterized protein n=1 Tax=Cacopsylla melanoneura TaxID=428564 RepID=A0A8D8VK28_9HEMI